MTIGKRLKELRTESGMSMDKLGELLTSDEKPNGVTKQAVNAWEKNRNQLNADQVIRICEIFTVNVGWFLTGKGVKRGGEPADQKQQDTPRNLDYFTDREKNLITIFRETDSSGRTFLESQASTVPRTRVKGDIRVINDKS